MRRAAEVPAAGARARLVPALPPRFPETLLASRQQKERRSRPYDFLEPPHELSDRNTHSAARITEFEKIEPPRTRLVLTDERLRLSEFLRQSLLAQAGVGAGLLKQLAQGFLLLPIGTQARAGLLHHEAAG